MRKCNHGCCACRASPRKRRFEMHWKMQFYMNCVAVNRVAKLGQVARALAASEESAKAGTMVGAGAAGREVAGLPAWYYDASGGGANVAKRDGYQTVFNSRTGSFEYLALDGKLYFDTGSGLKPKVGGILLSWRRRKGTLLYPGQASKEPK